MSHSVSSKPAVYVGLDVGRKDLPMKGRPLAADEPISLISYKYRQEPAARRMLVKIRAKCPTYTFELVIGSGAYVGRYVIQVTLPDGRHTLVYKSALKKTRPFIRAGKA